MTASQAFYNQAEENAEAMNAEPENRTKDVKIGLTFGELDTLDIAPREEIIRGLGRGENGLFNAVTNAGKTTIIRNLSLCLATGKQFPPLTVTNKNYRVVIIDTEDTLSFLRYDIRKMIAGFSAQEKEMVNTNLFFVCEPAATDGEIKLNRSDHFNLIISGLEVFKPDVVFIDTISSNFTIRNENDNSEIKEAVMKPLRKLARILNAAVFASHHIGKAKLEDGATSEASHKGRGASAFSDQSKTVFNLEKDAAGGTILSCAKIKGEKFADAILVYEKETRWFSNVGENKTYSNYQTIIDLFADGKKIKRKEIDEMLDGEMAKATITRNLKTAMERGDLTREKTLYLKNAHSLLNGNQTDTKTDAQSEQTQELQKNAQMLTPYRDEHLSIFESDGGKSDIPKAEIRDFCPECETHLAPYQDGQKMCGVCLYTTPKAERQN